MADDPKNPASADEIVDNLAAEMGVEDETVPAAEESAKDMMAGLGGIFDVPSSSKKKKKKKPAPEAAQGSDAEASDDAKKAPAKAAKKAKKADIAGVEGVFRPEAKDDEVIDLRKMEKSDYLSDGDLGDFVPGQGKKVAAKWVGVFVLLIAGFVGVLHLTGKLESVVYLFQGDLLERQNAETLRLAEEHKQAQMDAMDRFGSLQITGSPLHALIKLNGQVQYGQTSTESWRELRVGPSTILANLKIREAHQVEVSAPGFLPQTYTLTEGMWQQSSAGGDYQYSLTATLQPESVEKAQEFAARMEGDVENDYFGTVNFVTIPSGARITLNRRVALDKDGNELRTPVSVESYWARDDDGKLVEHKLKMDTPPDMGNRIELEIPDNDDMPKYLTALQRRMWNCEFKDERELRRIKDTDPYQKRCNYSWNLELDFNGLKRYIDEREAEIARIRKEIEEFNAANEVVAEGLE